MECRRRVLYHPSTQSKVAVSAVARVGQARRSSSSVLMVEKNDSATAWSQHCPRTPAAPDGVGRYVNHDGRRRRWSDRSSFSPSAAVTAAAPWPPDLPTDWPAGGGGPGHHRMILPWIVLSSSSMLLPYGEGATGSAATKLATRPSRRPGPSQLRGGSSRRGSSESRQRTHLLWPCWCASFRSLSSSLEGQHAVCPDAAASAA